MVLPLSFRGDKDDLREHLNYIKTVVDAAHARVVPVTNAPKAIRNSISGKVIIVFSGNGGRERPFYQRKKPGR